MKILVVGGGSGGHVTPVLAVIAAIKKERPRTEIHFWCDHSFAASARSLTKESGLSVPVSTIVSGKLRRYYGVPLWRQLLDLPTTFKNIVDAMKVVIGFVQSLVKLLFWFPDVVFTKGGFVCLPVGLAAHVFRIPLVIHDSDAHPGLTNRVLSKYATSIGTGAPLEYYSYPKERSHYIGIPIAAHFQPLEPKERALAKQKLGFEPTKPLIVVTGGGLGAKRINDAMIAIGSSLLGLTQVLHIAGASQYEAVKAAAPKDPAYQVLGFVSKNIEVMLGAADLVIARAGATTMLELAALAKPTILIPNAMLTGGHQTKNAKVYSDAHAVVVVDEATLASKPALLLEAVRLLLSDPKKQDLLSRNIAQFARPNAAEAMAQLIIDAGRGV